MLFPIEDLLDEERWYRLLLDAPHPDGLRRPNGHGAYDNDRPPILGVIGRSTGEVYLQETHRSKPKALPPGVESVTQRGATVMTDEWHAYDLLSATVRIHSTVNHLSKEWARDDDGDGVREVHANTIEGHWTGLRNFLRMCCGVHKRYPAQSVAFDQGRDDFEDAALQRQRSSPAASPGALDDAVTPRVAGNEYLICKPESIRAARVPR